MAEAILKEVHVSSMFDLRGVVAVVTGGATGIGLMISTTLISNGATVFVIGPVQEDLDRTCKVYNDAAEQTGRHGRMYGIQGDISQKSEALRLAEEVGKRVPHVTVLFNNAGVSEGNAARPEAPTAEAFKKAYFDTVTEEVFDKVLHTNAVGPYWLTFAFLPLLERWKESGYRGLGGKKFAPQVIMTSSMNGWTKDPATAEYTFPYLYSKSAIGHATSTLAHELLPLGIRVNGIAPGLFLTDMSAPGSTDELGVSRLTDTSKFSFQAPCFQPPPDDGSKPVNAGSRTDVGALALFLVSNWFVNGETVLIDGGTLLIHPSSY
ncbi:SDR family oxidoreductase [Phanerochaete sordida]|uniref:SDR family oxidoreductase n=1 Tax=Phanerochaete sordida TaxID=48140 RepID=A0A9P3FZ72_9APHY|nr:SDR family oxidoreductase [Phanerochaete sordida]